MLSQPRIELPSKLQPVFLGKYRYRGAYGGRGSGKTRSFAKMTAVKAIQLSQAGKRGIILCGREFMNSLDDSSMSEIKAAIASEPWMNDFFEIGEKFIRTKDKRIEYKFAGLSRNLDSIKSKSQIHLLWVDEAEPVSETAWLKIVPTVREEGSELWITWNPESKRSSTHKRFRENPPNDSNIVECNYSDNPWFPDVLEQTRLEDLQNRPEQYGHIWDGEMVTVVEGAYYAKHLIAAKQEGRIGRISFDPHLSIRIFCDIGGTGAKSDAFSMWPAQFVGREIRYRDYYEAVGQEAGTHLNWLRSKGYTPDRVTIVLPHDGETNDKVFAVSYESFFTNAGYNVQIVPNQGRGAAMMRVEAARKQFPSMWFDEETTEAGREALGWYHEKIDEERKIGLGPNHDWSSHAADSFGMSAVAYEPPVKVEEIEFSRRAAP